MVVKKLSIRGMNCNHCVMAVRNELSKIPSLTVKDVTIGSALVEYDEKKVTPTEIAAAVNEAGYTLVG